MRAEDPQTMQQSPSTCEVSYIPSLKDARSAQISTWTTDRDKCRQTISESSAVPLHTGLDFSIIHSQDSNLSLPPLIINMLTRIIGNQCACCISSVAISLIFPSCVAYTCSDPLSESHCGARSLVCRLL